MAEYSPNEQMIVRAARELRDGEVVFVGIGLPNLACNLAMRTHAPNLKLIYESGAVGARPERLPVSIGDPCLVAGALSVCSLPEVFLYYLQGGRIDVGFLGGAQIDRFGNLNTTVIGDYRQPKVRLPGSGGACEISLLAKRVLIVMPLSKRSFVDQLDFLTSPGFLSGGDERQKLGIGEEGPTTVVSDRGVFHFDPKTREMTLASRYENVRDEDILANVGWNMKIDSQVSVEPRPTEAELRMIREELDPEHVYI
jgi:glutaconate CoA-transferase subunit B